MEVKIKEEEDIGFLIYFLVSSLKKYGFGWVQWLTLVIPAT
jgi:hypothetical protein